jgi:hypothetical protein
MRKARNLTIIIQATAPVSAEIFGMKYLPSILSTLWLILTPPGTCTFHPTGMHSLLYTNDSSVAELIALGLREKHGNRIYLPTQIFTGALYFGAALSMWLIYARKSRKLW